MPKTPELKEQVMKPKSLYQQCKEKGLDYNKERRERKKQGKPGVFNVYQFGVGADWITGFKTDYSTIKY